MLRRCAMFPVQLFLALVSHSVIAQDPDGSGVEIQALGVNLMNPDTAGASSDFIRVASSVTASSVVNKHNDVRADVLASNMEYVDQTGVLTGEVNTWLGQCRYNEAMDVHWDSATHPYVNGFKAVSFFPDDIARIINLISRMSTSSSLYKLLMKSDMRYLGCGSVQSLQCPSLLSDYTLVACLYATRSQLNLTEAPYKSGEPCTECSSGIYWCDDSLCREDCYQSNAHCECRIDCGGYSSVSSNCSCLCPNGYEGNKCQPQDTVTDSDEDYSSEWSQGGTTLVVSVTLVLIALLAGSLCLVLYHKKYRLSKMRPQTSSESESSVRRSNIYVTSSSSPSSFDPSKYPSPPPAYSSISPTTGLDPPPYGYTASPTDAAEEVGDYESPPPYQQIDV